MNIQTVIMPLQDMMINKMILENLLTKGKVTIEEAYFMNELVENVITKIFKPEIKQIEETFIKHSNKNLTEESTVQTKEKTVENKKTELDESTMINLFLKK